MECPLTVPLCLSFLLFLTLREHCWVKRGGGRLASKGTKSRAKGKRAEKQRNSCRRVLRNPCGWHSRGAGGSPEHSLEVLVANVRVVLTLDSAVPRRYLSTCFRLTSALLPYPRLCCSWHSAGQHFLCFPTTILAQGGRHSLLKPLLNNVILRINLKDIVRPFNIPL